MTPPDNLKLPEEPEYFGHEGYPTTKDNEIDPPNFVHIDDYKQLRSAYDAKARECEKMIMALREIQSDCETVALDGTISVAERRTWRAIAHKCNNAIAAARSDGGKT